MAAYTNHVLPQYNKGALASLIDKTNRLESIGEPKVVLIGNSNLTFGMDSKRLSEAIGMPVVNMGLHGGLGNAFHEEMAKLNVCSGDIYIICHTDYADDDSIGNEQLVWTAIENNFFLWRLIRTKDYIDMLYAFPSYFKSSFSSLC